MIISIIILFSIIIILLVISILLYINYFIINSIFSNINDVILLVSVNGKILNCTPSFLTLFGYKKNQIKNLFLSNIFVENEILELSKINKIIIDKQIQLTGIKKNHEKLPVNVYFKKIKRFNKTYIIVEINNIEEQSLAEKKLRESQRLISTLIDNLPGVVYLSNNDSEFTKKFLSDGFYELTGFDPSDFIDNKRKKYIDIIHQEDKLIIQNEIKKSIKQKIPFHISYRITTSDNKEKWVWERGRPIFTNQKKLLAIGGFISDITEYKIMENKLAEEKERLSVTLRSIGDGVITTDTKGRIILVNNVAEKLTGWKQEEAFGKPLTDIFNIINEHTRKPCKNPIEKVLEHGKIVGLANHTVLIARDNTERMIADSGAPIKDRFSQIIGVVLVFRDVTEKYKMEQEMAKILKLESLGILAGGIAHDFNNILTAILGNINLAKLYSQDDKKIFEILMEAEKATYNSKHLTDQLLTFAKGGSPLKKAGSISKLLQESVMFALRGTNIKIEFNIDDDLELIDFDEGQINQVFNNLAINARQAMPGGGKIKILARNYFCEKDNLPVIKKGQYIQIIFEDQGIGIPEQFIPKIFDPFFSTKKEGKGLGLASCYSIIKKHEGFINVESKVKKGTKFYIYLPISNKEFFEERNILDKEEIIKGKGKILYMDDEIEIRNVAKKALQFLGYDTELAKDGNETLEKYKNAIKNKNDFDCVILDLTIQGGMGGKETLSELKKINPKINAIVTSGYSNDPVMSNFKKYGFKEAIIKPFRIEELSLILNRVLKKH